MRGVCLLASLVVLLAGWTWRSSVVPVRVPILMYHRVGSDLAGARSITDALTVPTAVFAAEMEWLKNTGHHAITLRRLYLALERGGTLPPKPVAITFDDGYRDVLWNASPILRRLHMPATDFVITGRISGSDPSFLTWPQVKLLERRGFAIGSHTVHHLELPHLAPKQALYELRASRRTLQQRLHQPVLFFAYPAGRFDALDAKLVSRAGYRLAFTTLPGDVQRVPLLLHREEILDTTGVRGLEGLVGSN